MIASPADATPIRAGVELDSEVGLGGGNALAACVNETRRVTTTAPSNTRLIICFFMASGFS